jgi:SagB-type dehydrogenase family enzyme
MDFALRPYPGGGALYELEVYLAVNSCEGIIPGLYRYDPLHHRLERHQGQTSEVAQLQSSAAGAAGIPAERLQVLVILAPRFQRVAWKYASMAYALILKHVGDLHLTMILDATTSGEAAINECTIQPLIPDLPFGGVGNSGMRKYHGEWGFRTHTNARGVLYHGTRIDPVLRDPPYSRQKASSELVAS